MKPQPTKSSAFADGLHQTSKFDESSNLSAKADDFVGCGFIPPLHATIHSPRQALALQIAFGNEFQAPVTSSANTQSGPFCRD